MDNTYQFEYNSWMWGRIIELLNFSVESESFILNSIILSLETLKIVNYARPYTQDELNSLYVDVETTDLAKAQ